MESTIEPIVKTLSLLSKTINNFVAAYNNVTTRYRLILIATPFASSNQMRKLYDTKMFETKELLPEQKKRINRITHHKNLNKNLALYLASNAKGQYIIDSLLSNKSLPLECKAVIALRNGGFSPQTDTWRPYSFKTLVVEFFFREECEPNCTGGPSSYRAKGVRNRRYPDFALLPSADPIFPVSAKWLTDSLLAIRLETDPIAKKALQEKFERISDRAEDLAGFMQDGNYKSKRGIRYTHEHKDSLPAGYVNS